KLAVSNSRSNSKQPNSFPGLSWSWKLTAGSGAAAGPILSSTPSVLAIRPFTRGSFIRVPISIVELPGHLRQGLPVRTRTGRNPERILTPLHNSYSLCRAILFNTDSCHPNLGASPKWRTAIGKQRSKLRRIKPHRDDVTHRGFGRARTSASSVEPLPTPRKDGGRPSRGTRRGTT